MDGPFSIALQSSDLCQQRKKKDIFAIEENKINHLPNLISKSETKNELHDISRVSHCIWHSVSTYIREKLTRRHIVEAEKRIN